MPSDEFHYQLMKRLEADPEASHRQLAEELGVSVGKTHYSLKALIERGWVKAGNFRRSDNKLAYAYYLTPQGVNEKARLALRYLRTKQAEYERLHAEIEALKQEVEQGGED